MQVGHPAALRRRWDQLNIAGVWGAVGELGLGMEAI